MNLEQKKGYSRGDYASPFYSMTIEREVAEDLSDEQLADRCDELAQIARKRVEKRINSDIQDLGKV